jgi:hypothetical protein
MDIFKKYESLQHIELSKLHWLNTTSDIYYDIDGVIPYLKLTFETIIDDVNYRVTIPKINICNSNIIINKTCYYNLEKPKSDYKINFPCSKDEDGSIVNFEIMEEER